MLPPAEENNPLGLEEITQAYLLETTRWTKFLAIVGFIAIGVMLLIALSIIFVGPMMSSYKGPASGSFNPFGTLGAVGLGIIYLAGICLYFYPVYALIKFSSCIKRGIKNQDQHSLKEGFRHQKNMYSYLGILTIITLVLYLILFLFGGLAAMMAIM